MAEHAEADALVGDGAKLLLHPAQGVAERGSGGYGRARCRGAGRHAYRVHAGEPADRAGQVGPGHHRFAAVALDVDEHVPGGAEAALHGHGQRGEQHVVDLAVEGERDGGEEVAGAFRFVDDGARAGGAGGVLGRVQGAAGEPGAGDVERLLPQGEFSLPLGGAGLLGQRPAPVPQGRLDRAEDGRAAGLGVLVGADEVGHDDPPGDAVAGEVVGHEQEPAGAVGTGVEPDDADHAPVDDVEFPLGARRLLRQQPQQPVAGDAPGGHAAHVIRGEDAADRPDLQGPAGDGAVETEPERVVVVDQRLDGGGQPVGAQAAGDPEQHGLVEAVDGPALVAQPVDDGGEGDVADGRRVLAGGPASGLPGDAGEGLDGLVLEDVLRDEDEAGPAQVADQLDGHDAVAAEVEEAPVARDVGLAEHRGEGGGDEVLPGGGRVVRGGCDRVRGGGLDRRDRSGGCGLGGRGPLGRHGERFRVGLAGQFAVGGPRERGGEPKLGRHQVGGEQCREPPAQSLRSGGRERVGRHQVGDEPGVACVVEADDDHRFGDLGVTGQRRLHLAGLHPVAVDLDLLVHPAEEVELPVVPAAHQVAGAVHPRSRRSERVGGEPFRGERRPAQVAPGQSVARQVQLPRAPRADLHQGRVEHVGADVAEGTADGRRRPVVRAVRAPGGGVHGRFGRPVHVQQAGVRHGRGHPLGERGGQRLAAQRQGPGRQVEVRALEELAEHRGDRADEAAGPAGRVTVQQEQQVSDDLDRAPGDQRREHLRDGDVEAERGRGERVPQRVRAELLLRPCEQRRHAAVRHDDALGGAGRARGVDDVRRVAGGERRGPVGVREVVRRGRGQFRPYRRVVEDHGRAGGSAEVPSGVRGVGEQAGGLGFLDHEAEALVGVGGVERQVGGTGLQDRQHRHERVGGAGQQQADEPFGACPPADEQPGQPVGPLVQLTVGQLAVRVADRDGVRDAARCRFEERGQRGLFRRDRGGGQCRGVRRGRFPGARRGEGGHGVARRGDGRGQQGVEPPGVRVGSFAGAFGTEDGKEGPSVGGLLQQEPGRGGRLDAEGSGGGRVVAEPEGGRRLPYVGDRPVQPGSGLRRPEGAADPGVPESLVPPGPARLAADLADEVGEGRVGPYVEAQRGHVLGRARHAPQGPLVPSVHGQTEDHVGGAGGPVQVDGDGGDQDRARMGAAVAGGGADAFRVGGRERHEGRRVRGGGGSGRSGGGEAGEAIPPEGEVLGGRRRGPVGVLGGGEQREAGELSLVRRGAGGERGVDLGGAAADERAAPAVEGAPGVQVEPGVAVVGEAEQGLGGA